MSIQASTPESNRRADLAKIHIAKKDLGLDDDTYREVIRRVGRAESGSSADLTVDGRARVLAHFRRTGWSNGKRKHGGGRGLASQNQVKLIRDIWAKLATAGIVRDHTDTGLRRWVTSATRRFHERRVGWSAPEFCPAPVAQRLIEQLKQWAARCDIDLHD